MSMKVTAATVGADLRTSHTFTMNFLQKNIL